MTGTNFLAYIKRKFIRTDKDTECYEAMTDIIADIRLRTDSEDYKEEAYISGISTLGDYRIALPSDFGHILGEISVIDSSSDQNYGTIMKISKEKYDTLYGDRLLTNYNDGVPKHFCIFAEQIYIGPVPDSTSYRYQINYTTENYTEMTSDAEIPFTDRYRNIIRAGVLMELHDGLENYEESNYWRVIYNDGVEKIIKNYNDNIDDNQPLEYAGI